MRRDALWSGLEAGVSAILSIVTSFVVARLVGPAELGIGAAVTAVHVVLWVAVNALFADALVQQADLDDGIASSAFWASAITGCIAVLPQALAGWPLAAAFGDPRLLPMALLLAAPLPLVGAAGVLQGLLTRERAYRGLALRTLIGQSLGTAVGVGSALAGAGAWAIVCQQAVTSACGAIALLVVHRWRPARRLHWPTIRALLSVGLPLTASTLVLIGRYRLFAVLIGASAGARVLGQVHITFRLVDTVRELAFTALWRLMLPCLSPHQHDRTAMLEQVDLWLRRCVLVMGPLCLLLFVSLHRLVGWTMGPSWAVAGQAAWPLILLMAWSTLMFPAGVALVALGQSRHALHANLLTLALVSAGALVLRPSSPEQAILIWSTSQLVVSPYMIWAGARALRVAFFRPITGGLTR